MLETSIEDAIEVLGELIITTEEFASESQEPLFHKINLLLQHFQTMDRERYSDDIELPLGILPHLDEGRNPDHFTKEILENCVEKSNKTRGKLYSLKVLKDSLASELKEIFPEESGEYEQSINRKL